MDNEEKGVKIASSIIILERVRSTSSGISKVSDTNLGRIQENFHFPWFLSLYYQIAAQKKFALSVSIYFERGRRKQVRVKQDCSNWSLKDRLVVEGRSALCLLCVSAPRVMKRRSNSIHRLHTQRTLTKCPPSSARASFYFEFEIRAFQIGRLG